MQMHLHSTYSPLHTWPRDPLELTGLARHHGTYAFPVSTSVIHALLLRQTSVKKCSYGLLAASWIRGPTLAILLCAAPDHLLYLFSLVQLKVAC